MHECHLRKELLSYPVSIFCFTLYTVYTLYPDLCTPVYWVECEKGDLTSVRADGCLCSLCIASLLSCLLLLLSHFSLCPTLCDPIDAGHQAPPSLGFSRQEHWSGLPFPSPMHESEKWKWSHSVVSDSYRPHGLQPTRLLCPWDFPGKSTGVGCHCLLHKLLIARAFWNNLNDRCEKCSSGMSCICQEKKSVHFSPWVWHS